MQYRSLSTNWTLGAGTNLAATLGISRPAARTISERYEELCRVPCDINEHLPTLARYAAECSHVTECGVRSAVSSYAFGHALLPKRPNCKLIQVDLEPHQNIAVFQERCRAEGLPSVFYAQSDLACPQEETELLFLDTWHNYGQLKREFARWHSFARKYILLHDTTVDEWVGETVRLGWDVEAASRSSGMPVEEISKGLWPAVEEFLAEHQEWELRERFINNNGLTVLARK